MNTRTQNILQSGCSDLEGVLQALGFDVEAGASEADLILLIGSKSVAVEIKQVSVASMATVEHLVGTPQRRRGRVLHLLVADRISFAARAKLREAGWGWLDRRGHVRLWEPGAGIRIETETQPLVTKASVDYEEPLATGVGRDVAVALLLAPHQDHSAVRELARELNRAPSAVSVALRRLREQALVNEQGRPLIPELFYELSRLWAPKRVALAGKPMPGDPPNMLMRLGFNLEEPVEQGWALTDTLAAYAYGAAVVVGSGYPPDFYVASERILREAIRQFQIAPSYDARACTVSVAPVKAATAYRVDQSRVADIDFLLSRPLFVAFELARDEARGREILDGWTPEGFPRVW